ncbi:adenylate/guanylate cyclase domain-containing protein [Thalassospira australica]|uniref:adenylate/guanylate cyclase domain-containing protein n=1 Tax=Thalassospira australica TaxID=1528106 RepID=UPI0038516F4F
MATDTKHAQTIRPHDGHVIPANTTAPGQVLLGRYILSMAGMAIIDVCFSGAYVLISGNFAVIWRAAIVNAAILLILNVMGAAIIFRPVYRLINALARGDAVKRGPGLRRLRKLHVLSAIWAFIVGLAYCLAAFGLGIFNANPLYVAETDLTTKVYAASWFSFAYAAHFSIYAFFATADCVEVIRKQTHDLWGIDYHPGRGRIGLRLAIVILALTLISSMAILLDITLFRDIRAAQGLSVEQAVILDVIATETAAVLCLFFISRTLTRPIGQLTDAVREIGAGKTATRIAVTSDDEVSRLAFEFNRMAAGLEEKDRMRRAFERYVSQDVVDLAMAREQSGDPRAAGELRFATVMFTDISGFTRLSENMEPADIIALLNEYFDLVNAPIRNHRGVVLNYVGDALHAVFNVLHDDPDHAANAVRAAITMQNITRHHKFAGTMQIETRVGIHSGPVVAGPVGSGDRIDFTIQGDTANLASRLEAMNKETGTEILISATTRELANTVTDANIAFKPLGSFTIRGRQQVVDLFTISDDAKA